MLSASPATLISVAAALHMPMARPIACAFAGFLLGFRSYPIIDMHNMYKYFLIIIMYVTDHLMSIHVCRAYGLK